MDRIKEIVKRSTVHFGLILVECLVSGDKIEAVIYRKNGNVGIGDLENVTKDIQGELSSIGLEGVYSIELSSPGLNRVLKAREELDIFKGKMVKVSFMDDEKLMTEEAILKGLSGDNKVVILRRNGERVEIPFDRLIKVSLYDESLKKGGGNRK